MAAWTKDQPKFDALWHGVDAARRRELATAENQHGWRAVHFACVSGELGMLRPLLEDVGGAAAALEQVRAPTKQGWFPLHYACGFGQTAAIDTLLAAGADLDVTNERSTACRGWTPWHRALRWWLSPGKPNAIAHLLSQCGVRADARAADGRTAAALANPEVHEALERMLRAEVAGGGGNESAAAALGDLVDVRALWRAEQAAEVGGAAGGATAAAASSPGAAAAAAAAAAAGNGEDVVSGSDSGDDDSGDDDSALEALGALEARISALDAKEVDVIANPAKYGLSSRADCMAREADIALEKERLLSQVAALRLRSSSSE